MSKSIHSAPGTSSALRESCADLIRRLRKGEAARAEQYLAQFPYLAADAEAAVELIYTEFAGREELGGRPSETEYFDRFPERREALRRQFDIHRLLSEGPNGDAAAAIDSADDATGDADLGNEMPARLGAYELLRPLGRGGMGVVYLARHVELGRPAALKILAGSRGDDESLALRFRDEVRSAAALGHPQIVQLYELGETPDGRLFAAFEYVDGGSLHQAIAGRPRPARAAAQLLLQVAEATACAHRAGIVHCDLTPANVLLTRDGTPKIADFGLARLPRGGDVAGGTLDDETASETSALAGTPGYMAPERIDRPDEANPAVDVYGLGAVFYELLTGRPPLVGATPLETLRRTREEDAPSPRLVIPSIPRDAATICLKCLARDPARRYSDAASLADDLRKFLAGEPIAARPTGVVERTWKWARRRPGLAAALVTAAAALTALLVGGTRYNVRLREALHQTELQERQIRSQAGELTGRLDQLRRNVFTLQLNQAEALVDRAPHLALALLRDDAQSPPELRDFAWGLLVERASQDRRTLVGHGGAIGAVRYAADGMLVSAASDDTVNRWNPATGELVDAIPVDTVDARLMSLAPGATRLAASFDDGTIRTWSFAGQDVVERLHVGHSGRVTALAFFPDGRWLASADETGQIVIWDPSGQPIAVFAVGDDSRATALAVSPEGKTLAVGGSDGAVQLLDAVEGTKRGQLLGHAGGVAALVFVGGNEKLAAVGAIGGRIDVWDLATRSTISSIDLRGSVVRSIAVSDDGRRLALATTEHALGVVDLSTGEMLAEYRGHADVVAALAFSPGGETLVSGSDDRTVKLWDVPGKKIPIVAPGDDLKTLAVGFSRDGNTVATAGYDGTIRLCDAETGREVKRLTGHEAAVRAVRFIDDGRRLLSCGEDSTVRLWDVAGAKLLQTWQHPAWVLDVVAPTAAEFVTVCADGSVRRFYFDHEAPAAVIATPATIEVAALSADGRRLATVRNTTIRVVDLADGKIVCTPTGLEKNGLSLAFSGDGKLLAVGDDAGVVHLWNATSGELWQTLRGHSRGVYAVAFSPDGRLVASSSGGRWVQLSGETKLWDVESGQVHATLDGATAPTAFSPDGRRLAVSRDGDRAIDIWTAAPYGR